MLASLPLLVVKELEGQESDVGLVMGVFAVSAVTVRPFVGRAADRWGRKGLMAGGAALMVMTAIAFILVPSITFLLPLRFVQGMGWGAFSTAAAALIADVAPASRRGEALGYYGMFAGIAMAVGPAVGVFLADSYGFPAMFALSAAAAAAGMVCSLAIVEPRPALQRSAAPLSLTNTLHRKSFFPSSVIFCSSVPYSAVMTFIPVFAAAQGIGNPGLFFTVYAISLVVFRAPIGKLSDILGRKPVIGPGLVVGALSLAILSQAGSMPMFVLVAFLYGLHFAAVQPLLMAMTVDRVSPGERGAAMGTFTLAMDLGIGIGAFLWGYVAEAVGFNSTYVIAAALTSVGLGVLLLGRRR